MHTSFNAYRLFFGLISSICVYFLNPQLIYSQQESIVYIESISEEDSQPTIALGVILKDGFIATNYHAIAGAKTVKVYPQKGNKYLKSDGYLDVDESKDLIVLSVPGLSGKPAVLAGQDSLPDGSPAIFFSTHSLTSLESHSATLKGGKDFGELYLRQYLLELVNGPVKGPVFHQNKLIGFCTAGYYDELYYAFAISAQELNRLLRRSFIIKDYTFLDKYKKLNNSHLQKQLMESLTKVLWMEFEDAVSLSEKKPKKILIDVYTDWCGWCKVMEQNTYSKKNIIRYLNENYYAVKLNAESKKKISFRNKLFEYTSALRSHQLAYSLLEGIMEYPSTVFLDEDINLLTVVRGYISPESMEVALLYFKRNIYKDKKMTFQEFEKQYLESKE